jgi:hypothetical protein
MARLLFFRTTSAVGVVALGLFFVGAYPFLGASAGPHNAIPVDRSLKGDRLPISIAPDRQKEFGAQGAEPRAQMPFACDAAFSMISSSAAANFYGRCMA